MDIQITARHFKSRPSLQQFVRESLQDLAQLYNGIVNAKVILAIEPHNEGKIAEIELLVYNDKLFAKEKSDDFEKSVVSCVNKLTSQLRRYKGKLHNRRQPQRRDEMIVPEDDKS